MNPMLETKTGVGDILVGPVLDPGAFLFTERFDHFGRGPQNQRTGWDHGPSSHQGLGPYDTLSPNHGSIQNGRSHPDEAFIFHGACMKDGRVTYRDKITDQTREIIS